MSDSGEVADWGREFLPPILEISREVSGAEWALLRAAMACRSCAGSVIMMAVWSNK
jgi:hypothetical protein